MMPDSGDHSAAMQESSGSMARAALPPMISSPSTPLALPCGHDGLDLGQFGRIRRHDELAAFAMSDAVGRAKLVEQPPSARAVAGAQRAGRVVEAAVDHLAVARGDAVGDAAGRFGDGDIVPAQSRRARDRKPDDARADHKDLHRVSALTAVIPGPSEARSPESITTVAQIMAQIVKKLTSGVMDSGPAGFARVPE